MFSKFKYIIFIIIVLSLTSCGSSGDGTKKQFGDEFTGTWNWVRTTGGFAGGMITPDSTGKNIKLVFSGDGKVLQFEDMSIIFSGTYQVTKDITIFSQDSVPVIIFGKMTYSYLFPSENNLMLIENVYDGFTYEYIKEK